MDRKCRNGDDNLKYAYITGRETEGKQKYLTCGSDGRNTITTNINSAMKWEDVASAYTYLQRHVSSNIRDSFQVELIELPDQKSLKKMRYYPDKSNINFDWDSVAENLESIFKGVHEYQRSLERQLAPIEDELNDCYHASEIISDCSDEYKAELFDIQQDRRRARRVLKDEIAKCNAVMLSSKEEIANGELCEKFRIINNHGYTPRKLDSIFA